MFFLCNFIRISAMMSSQEIGSTNSQNLMDINRPSIIKEKFRHLYINEWAEVADQLDIQDEKENAKVLLDILFVG